MREMAFYCRRTGHRERGRRFDERSRRNGGQDSRELTELSSLLHDLSVSLARTITVFGIPRRYSHFIFAVIQAGLTCLIAAGIASFPVVSIRQFITHWLLSWLISWIMMLPVVVLAAPVIRFVSLRLTSGE
jgi:hypothetical protein